MLPPDSKSTQTIHGFRRSPLRKLKWLILMGLPITAGAALLFSAQPSCACLPVTKSGRIFVKTLNLTQQAYHLDRRTFSSEVAVFPDIERMMSNRYYDYNLQVINQNENSKSLQKNVEIAYVSAVARQPYYPSFLGLLNWRSEFQFKSYVGAVAFVPQTQTFVSTICEFAGVHMGSLQKPKLDNDQWICPSRSHTSP
jgi:Type IV pilin-like G and H, putative